MCGLAADEAEGLLRAGGNEDHLRKIRGLCFVAEVETEVFVGGGSQLLASLDNGCEDVHRVGAARAAAVQAHVTSARTDACTKLRCIVMQGTTGMV